MKEVKGRRRKGKGSLCEASGDLKEEEVRRVEVEGRGEG